MKILPILCFLLCGCAGPQMMLVNNTPYRLDVTASNHLLYTNLPPGHVVPIAVNPWQQRTGVAVAAYDEKGRYVGANDWIYYCGQDQVWRIDRINKPQP